MDYNQSKVFWDRMFEKSNVKYLGNIPYEELPETVARWNVGLVTDKMDEYASFMHHNKVYQYLALGIPVVSLKIHEDYMDASSLCTVWLKIIHNILKLSDLHWNKVKPNHSKKSCIEMARLNSSEVRAKEFLSLIKTI